METYTKGKVKTFCAAWLLCKKGTVCRKALTESVKDAARNLGLPIAQYAGMPECFRCLWDDVQVAEPVKEDR